MYFAQTMFTLGECGNLERTNIVFSFLSHNHQKKSIYKIIVTGKINYLPQRFQVVITDKSPPRIVIPGLVCILMISSLYLNIEITSSIQN